MRRFLSTYVFLAAALSASSVFAAINSSGSISGTFASGSTNYIGYSGAGSVTVDTAYPDSPLPSSGNLSTLYVGYNGVGTLTVGDVNGGGVVNGGKTYIADLIGGSTSSVTVNGIAGTASWTPTTGFYDGYVAGGYATVNIENGGTVSIATSNLPTYVGYSGYGTVDITGGGTLTNTGFQNSIPASARSSTAVLAYNAGSTGSVTVSGAGSTWTSGADGTTCATVVGNNGNGTLLVNSGGTVNFHTNGTANDGGYIAYDAASTSSVTVNGATSTWNVGDAAYGTNLWVGLNGNGTLNISNGATVNVFGTGTSEASVTGNVTLAANAGSTGAINFLNGGTLNCGGTLQASGSQLTGTGAVNATGLITDGTILLDGHGTSVPGNPITQSFPLINSTGTVTVKLSTFVSDGNNQNGYGGGANEVGVNTFAALGAGYTGNGSLTIQGGLQVISENGYLGYQAGSIGTGIVTGAGSTWTPVILYLGYNSGATGKLTVANGGTVNTYNGSVYIGANAGSTGTLIIDGAGSNVTLYPLAPGNSNIGQFCVGQSGTGTLNVTNGGTVSLTNQGASAGILVGQMTGSTGTINVDGAGSTITGATTWVGSNGTGTVNITHGGVVNDNAGYLCDSVSSNNNVVAVDGVGSQWNNTVADTYSTSNPNGYALYVGGAAVNLTGTGHQGTNQQLYISGGGTVTAVNAVVYGPYAGPSNQFGGDPAVSDLLSIDVGRGSSLTLTGSAQEFTNQGTVRIVAGAGAAVNSAYAPIVATTWDGSGVYQAVGGTWDSVNHVFAVSAAVAASGAGGAADSLNTSSNQRMLITDTAAHTSVGVSFLSTEGAVTLTGTTVTGAALSSLEGLLPAGQAPLDAWGFSSVTGYTAGDPVYLSLSLGAGYSPYQLATAGFTRTNLTVWDYNGTSWSQMLASDLTFDGTYASFTAALNGTALNGTALNGYDYAVVGTPLLLGDANRDGRVDINDLTIVLANYNQTGMTWAQGEFTGSGTVDINDLTIVLSNYNTSVGSSAAGLSAVPEPGTLLLLAAGLIALLACVWRKRK